ncbi:MAG: TIGR03089 family protein [Galactobacter sp.]
MSALASPLDLLTRRDGSPRPLLVDASLPPARVELSGRVLANWWAKNLGLLSTEFSLSPGDRVEFQAAASWRTVPLALAALTLGATVSENSVEAADTDLVITDHLDDKILAAPEVLAVATEPLALHFGTALPAGVVDHAAEVRAHPDQPMFDASAAASSRLSPVPGEEPTAGLDWLADAAHRSSGMDQVVSLSTGHGVLAAAIQVLAAGETGHVVLHAGATPDERLAAQEGITATGPTW